MFDYVILRGSAAALDRDSSERQAVKELQQRSRISALRNVKQPIYFGI